MGAAQNNSSDSSVFKDAEAWLKSLSPELKGNLDQMQKLWVHPVTQFGVTLGRDSEFMASLNQINESHRSTQLYAYEAVLLVLLWIFRAWKLSKVSTLWSRLWTQAWIGAVFWFLALVGIPGVIWGEAYRTALSHFARAFLKHFLLS